MRFFRNAVAAICMAMAISPSAQAALIAVTGTDLTSSRSTDVGGGLIGSGSWSGKNALTDQTDQGGFKIQWTITFDAKTQLWTYVYKLSNADGTVPTSQEVSHWNLQVSDTFTSSNVKDGSTTPNNGSPSIFDPANGGGNEDMPGTLYALQWDAPDKTTGEIKLVTDRAPVWGSFYSKDGEFNTGGKDGVKFPTYVYNIGFTGDDTNTDDLVDPSFTRPTAGTKVFTNWIATPDTTTSPPPETVPEPSSIALAAISVIGFGAAYRRRKRKQNA